MADGRSRGQPRDVAAHPELHVGIADEDSFLRNEYWPTGVARGWRRTGCVGAIALGFVLLVLVLAVAVLAD